MGLPLPLGEGQPFDRSSAIEPSGANREERLAGLSVRENCCPSPAAVAATSPEGEVASETLEAKMITTTSVKSGSRIYRHSLVIRITHWINVVSMTALLMSGLQIFN